MPSVVDKKRVVQVSVIVLNSRFGKKDAWMSSSSCIFIIWSSKHLSIQIPILLRRPLKTGEHRVTATVAQGEETAVPYTLAVRAWAPSLSRLIRHFSLVI